MLTEAECRTIVRMRSNGMCEVRWPDVCRGPGESMHHRNKAGQGGLWTPANVLHTCGHGTAGCHGHIEANPASSKRKGLWLYRGQDPARTPAHMVWRGMRGVYQPHDDGSITWLSERALERMG